MMVHPGQQEDRQRVIARLEDDDQRRRQRSWSGAQLVFDVAAARDCIGSAARGLTLVTWRPRADAPGGVEPVAGQSRPSSTELN